MANYKLLKALPGIESGDIRSEEEWKEETNRNPKYYPDWFEEIKQKWPKSWKELGTITGHYIKSDGELSFISECNCVDENKNIFPAKKHAESALAFAMLSQISQRMNGDFVKNWSDLREQCWTIFRYGNNLIIGDFTQSFYPICFATEEMAEFSLKNHRELWEKYWMI